MKICMMSLTMGESTPEEIVDTAVKCGMKHIDWITTHNSDPEWLGKISRDAGLKVEAYTPLDQAYINGDSNWKDEFRYFFVQNAKEIIMEYSTNFIPKRARKRESVEIFPEKRLKS